MLKILIKTHLIFLILALLQNNKYEMNIVYIAFHVLLWMYWAYIVRQYYKDIRLVKWKQKNGIPMDCKKQNKHKQNMNNIKNKKNKNERYGVNSKKRNRINEEMTRLK